MSKKAKKMIKNIINKMPRVITLRNISLMPGSNPITEKQAKENDEQIKLFTRLKQIEVTDLEVAASSDDGGDEVVLGELNAKDAIELIETTTGVLDLEKWAETEDRKTVLAAIEKRIETINEETAAE